MQELGRVEFVQQIEAVGHVQLITVGRVLGDDLQRVVCAHFAHCGGVRVLVQQRAQPFQERQILGLSLVVNMALPVVGVDQFRIRSFQATA